MKKADIVIRYYDGAARPVVNVKIYPFGAQFEPIARKVAEDNGDTSGLFTLDWIDANLSQAEQSNEWDWAIERAWGQLREDIDAEKVFGIYKRTLTSYGRSGGWAGFAEFTADDVQAWNAIDVAHWFKFARFARETADNVPYQYLSLIYLSHFEPVLTITQQNAYRRVLRDA